MKKYPKLTASDISELPLEMDQRVAMCWNILRTCTYEQLASMERQVDAIIEGGTMVVGVNVGPKLPF